MREAQIEYLKQLMLKEREDQQKRIQNINDAGLGETMDDSLGELSTIDNHPGDIGSEMFERSKDFALKEQSRTIVKAIDNALAAIKNGTYGKCEICNRDIPYERLEAVPYTTICSECKAEDEKASFRHPRPIEEEVLTYPFERTFNDNKDKNFYDGGDTWQEIARHSLSYETAPEWDQRQAQGGVEEVENIPYETGDDGVFYESFHPTDSEALKKADLDEAHRYSTEHPQH